MPAYTMLGRIAPDSATEAVRLAVLRLRMAAVVREAAPWLPLPHQVPPDGDDWGAWVLMGGRGSGKTDAGSHAVNQHAESTPCLPGPVPHRMAIISTTHDDAVDTCVRGESGILRADPRVRFRPGSSLFADLSWPNGAEANLFGTFVPEDVERFRGPQHCFYWADELAAWRKLDDAWDMIEFGLRLGPHPRGVITTTPKLRKRFIEIMKRADTIVTHAKLSDNPHLDAKRRAKLYERYGGTQLGRQELDAELIDDIEGALWRRAMIEQARRTVAPELRRIVVSVDPAVTSGDGSDETGIIVAGVDARDPSHGYVLADLSGRYAPIDWARRAVDAYHTFKADRVVAEVNNGGDMVEATLRAVDPSVAYRAVRASRGKAVRAEPVAAMYEQARIHHIGAYPELEDQQCTWLPGSDDKSPDRMDAMVWAFHELLIPTEANPWQGMKSAGGVA